MDLFDYLVIFCIVWFFSFTPNAQLVSIERKVDYLVTQEQAQAKAEKQFWTYQDMDVDCTHCHMPRVEI